ncbi:MAG: ArsC/Spx/MgsR family protein [Flavobacteriaceae bacterium]|nr:arsenate reductase [Flavobacteriaceae bacterium]MDC3221125.1 arsenate reductase [Flavobacteriaceae bacterium]MDG2485343.1 ArsC/Spx/MgsR family protein [Flavobacteriaceae bacterium]
MKFNHNIFLHNPRCRKSREAMEFLKFHNLNFETLLYMKDGLEINQLKEIIDKLNVNPIDLVRRQEKIWKENYKSKKLSDNEIIDLLHKYSNLIKRPIFISNNKAIIAIPSEEINKII